MTKNVLPKILNSADVRNEGHKHFEGTRRTANCKIEK
jgi:hypothetical protein